MTGTRTRSRRPEDADCEATLARGAGKPTLLIIEADPAFARVMLDYASGHGFHGVVALNGREGLDVAHRLQPDAIVLDLGLPDMNGWAVLDRLKHQARTRHIPVTVLSDAGDELRSLEAGAWAFLPGPVSRDALDAALASLARLSPSTGRCLWIIDPDGDRRRAVVEALGSEDIRVIATDDILRVEGDPITPGEYGCLAIGLGQPICELEGVRDLYALSGLQRLPVLCYGGTGEDLDLELLFRPLQDIAIVKKVASREQLVEEVSLFLHRVEDELPEPQRQMLQRQDSSCAALAHRKILVVDDDIRNIFALTTILEEHDIEVLNAENGQAALQRLSETPDIAIVLMDVMMPEMDGYEAMRRIRAQPEFEDLPVIALTAKAMKEDRQKCIQAGASDYITKPVDPDYLISLLRVWSDAERKARLPTEESTMYSEPTPVD